MYISTCTYHLNQPNYPVPVCSLASYSLAAVYSIATVIFHCILLLFLFLYLPIVHLIPFLHCWLETVSKHFIVRSTPVVFAARDK
jgi:hypothetical protein